MDQHPLVTKVGHFIFAIDQHAAHERVLLERLQHQTFGQSGLEFNVQTRQVDIHHSITPQEYLWLEEYKTLINRFKWEYTLYCTDGSVVTVTT